MDAKPKARKGRKKTGKVTVTLRLFQETKDLLEKAALETRSSSLSQYAEKAMLAQFKKDGID
jgi:uncharacterized protein (DUF1778 family)